ncbi:Ig-like domain-containing protein, partial [Pseudomonas fragi]|uniref:Ig-like domain-containing protein n=1 Tax=Pseudomonas fragi TaxID=296 RepID=UPI0020057457
PLNDGEHPFTLVVTDPAGNASAPSDPYTITVDTTAPAAPVITGVLDDQAGITGNISSGGLTNDARPTISGTGEPGATVEVSSNRVPLGTAVVNASGQWTLPVTTDLPENLNTLTAKATDTAGNASPTSTPYPITVDTTAPATPAITGVLDDQAGITGNISSGGLTNDARPTISGTGEPGTTVEVSSNGVPLGTALVNASGQWTLPVTADLPENLNTLTAKATDTAGNASPTSTPYPIIVDASAPAAPAITGVLDDQGTLTGNILSGGFTDDTKPVISGTGEPGTTVEIFSNGTPLGTALVNASGQWTLPVTADLPQTLNTFTAIATDTAGNTSGPAAPYTVTVDTSAPLAKAIVSSISKDSGSNTGDFLTHDGSAGRLITGTLSAAVTANEKVQVSLDNGNTWLDAVINGPGSWSFVDNSSHAADWNIQTRVANKAGNTSVVDTQHVTLDTTPPEAPSSAVRSGDNVTVGLTGTQVQVGDSVFVTVGGQQVSHVLTQAEINAGSVVVTVPTGVTGGIQAFLVDKAGNASDIRTDASSTIEKFDLLPHDFNLQAGQSWEFDSFTLRNISGSDVYNSWTALNTGARSGLWFGHDYVNNNHAILDLKHETSSISFTHSWSDVASNYVRFMDINGNMIEQVILPVVDASFVDFTYTAPPGVLIASIEIFAEWQQNGIYIDNLKLDGGSTVIPHPEYTTITESGQYYGTQTNNEFSVADVSILSTSGSGVHGGEGIDTLKLTGQGQVLDLTLLGHKVESIEVIDLTGTGNNTLKLSLTDVLEQGGTSLFTNDGHIQMMVKGNAGDAVILDDLLANGTDPGNWANSGQVNVSGVVYEVYRHDTLDAELLVQQGVTTTLV